MIRILLNEAIRAERENCLASGSYERPDERKGYANGYKPKTMNAWGGVRSASPFSRCERMAFTRVRSIKACAASGP